MKLIPVLNINIKFISLHYQFNTEMKVFVPQEKLNYASFF
jgi:hypothetical protein